MGALDQRFLRAPFPYPGGKSRVADLVWLALGQVDAYIEPFLGSGAVLLARPTPGLGKEIVGDKDALVCNAWRALKKDPEAVAYYCDWPTNHADLIVRRRRLREAYKDLVTRVEDDEEFNDPRLAGYWIYAVSSTIQAIRNVTSIPKIIKKAGIHRHTISNGESGNFYNLNIYHWFCTLSERLQDVRIICGDWVKTVREGRKLSCGKIGLFLDPPYGSLSRSQGVYFLDDFQVAKSVTNWCLEHDQDPTIRIVLAGFFEEHEKLLDRGWITWKWVSSGGMARVQRNKKNVNRFRETLFFSPYCQVANRLQLGYQTELKLSVSQEEG